MSDTSANNKRIAKNTLLLYVRMLFLMAISLFYESRHLERPWCGGLEGQVH